jgi:hypothetical protein
MTIPASLVGKPFTVAQRVIGELRPDEYSVTGNQLTLLTGELNPGDTYFFKGASVNTETASGTYKTSPIANYVYYWFMRDNHTQTAPVGEVKTTTENAVLANPFLKMARAYNEAAEAVGRLRDYLDANESLYNWDSPCNAFGSINVMNI